MKSFALILLIGLSLTTWTQEIVIQGTILNSDNVPVSNARVYLKSNPNEKIRSSRNGNYSIDFKRNSNDTLCIEHTAYQSKYIPITRKLEKRVSNDTLNLNVTLENRTLMTIEVTIKEQKPDTVFGTQDYSVEDFEFDKNGYLILLTYDKNIQTGSELKLIGSDNKVLDRFEVPDKAIELQKDFRNQIHLITDERIFLIVIEDLKFSVYLEDRDYYFRYVAPIIDTINQFIYFSNYSELYPAFDYWEFNRMDSIYKKLLNVEDEVMMEMYRAEFKYVDTRTKIWAHQKQLETGIDKEIWVGATVFANTIYYEPVYAPLFKIGKDSVVIFDHYKNMLFIYHPEKGMLDSVQINYHKDARRNGWEQPLIQDEVNGKVYAYFVRAGFTYLYEIDLVTGEIKNAFKLYFKYVDRIQIINDVVYYIYRPYESIQKKYIYSEKLK